MATGFFDSNGIWNYGEDDNIALFSDTLNKLADSTSDAFTADRNRLSTLEAGSLSGLIPIKPGSITAVSGTASVNSLGTVTFTNCSAVWLQNVFGSQYQNYRLVVTGTKNNVVTNTTVVSRLIDSTTSQVSSNYSGGFNGLEAGYTAATNYNGTDAAYITHLNNSVQNLLFEMVISRPFETKPTIFMSDAVGFAPGNAVYRSWSGTTHTTPTSYPGILFALSGGLLLSGQAQVFGYND